MKKLFTLLALLTCFLGAKAQLQTIVDAEVDYSTMPDGDASTIKFYGWGASDEAKARLSIKDGCLHFENAAATDPTWACQFHPIGGVSASEGVTYTLHFKVKGDHAENISALGFGTTPYGQFPITTEWVEGTYEYVGTKDNNGNVGGDLLFQCGGYIGSWDIAYLKITHEEVVQTVDWKGILTNGDAGTAWADANMSPTNEQFGTICAWSKEWGYLMNDTENAAQGTPAIPVAHPAIIEDGAFVCHAKAVDPPLLEGADGERWGNAYKAGDEMPNNTWQNQFWIAFPRPMKDGEPVKISFKYKASEAVTVSTQDHTGIGDYLGGGNVGNLSFTTGWQTFEKQFDAAKGVQSIAFNVTGDGENWKKDIDFYFDDLSVSIMDLKEGFFVAGIDAEKGDFNKFNFNDAIELVYNSKAQAYVGVVGTEADEDSWVNQVMISTAFGHNKGFKANTIVPATRVKNDPDEWPAYKDAANSKINLPARGVWQISVDKERHQINFVKKAGEADQQPIDTVVNKTEVVVNAVERKYKSAAEAEADNVELPEGYASDVAEDNNPWGQPWDNQFFLVANRELKSGEVTVVEFDYVANLEEAKTTTQTHGNPGDYVGNGIGDVTFTNELQHFKGDFTVPTSEKVMKSIAFNMAEIRGACVYTLKNFKWYLKDEDLNKDGLTLENLIDATAQDCFVIKVGAGTAPQPMGIETVVSSKPVSTATYNLAGQRVSKDYKGIVVKNGKKFVVK